MQIETVRGPIETAHLGVTLMHEHIFVLTTEVLQNYPEKWDEAVRVANAVAKLNELTTRGVQTIVDPTVVGLGRCIPIIQRIAQQTPLQIVVATGLYTYNEVPMYFQYRGPGTALGGPEVMTEMFVKDITEGIAGTGVKAAILKCATDSAGLTPGVERVLRAVAQAHRQTGIPITTHTDAHTHRGRDQQRVFKEEGVDLRRVIIGHCGDTTEVDYLKELIENGSTIGMDRFGIDMTLPFDDRVNTVVALCTQGYGDRMVLSHDAACFIDWFDPAMMHTAAPKWTYTHIPDDVLPALRARGVSDAQIRQMLVDNPRRIFEHGGTY
jgi:phosphotriesterase-related protein